MSLTSFSSANLACDCASDSAKAMAQFKSLEVYFIQESFGVSVLSRYEFDANILIMKATCMFSVVCVRCSPDKSIKPDSTGGM